MSMIRVPLPRAASGTASRFRGRQVPNSVGVRAVQRLERDRKALEDMRADGNGPPWLKVCGRVTYFVPTLWSGLSNPESTSTT
jgi:hypothetical protein